MKKTAFTLSEMIVAVAVIGLIAAISVPLINNVIPDRKKVEVLKIHKLLTNINAELLADPGLYMQDEPVGCNGLECTAPPNNWPPANINDIPQNLNDAVVSPESKYIALLAYYLKASDVTGIEAGSSNGRFTTPDGLVWSLDEDKNITVNINETGGNPCPFGAGCENPNEFIFMVANTGKVFGGDALTITYLSNPHNLSDRKNDFRNATIYQEKLLEEAEKLKEEEEASNE